jgi:hypothetical protein
MYSLCKNEYSIFKPTYERDKGRKKKKRDEPNYNNTYKHGHATRKFLVQLSSASKNMLQILGTHACK